MVTAVMMPLLVSGFFAFSPQFSFAQSVGHQEQFFVDGSYDSKGRTELSATLRHRGNNALFYIEDAWWDNLSSSERGGLHGKIIALGDEFDSTIYPRLRREFGSEARPGIDGNDRIYVLLHEMGENAGGYFNSADGYPALQTPRSNEKEIVYLNVVHAGNNLLRSFLAHEFMHLITLNQKDLTRGVREETWLNELRAEYAPTFLGYDEAWEESSLRQRMQAFLQDPEVSLTEWQNSSADYGVSALFGHYLVDHYGVRVLKDSLQSPLVGIASLEHALRLQGVEKSFSRVFSEWAIAALLNDCNAGSSYCYAHERLQDLKVSPQSNFLPSGASANLAVTKATKNWAGNWQRIVGGRGVLELEFDPHGKRFIVPYVTEPVHGEREVRFLELNEEGKGTIEIPGFSTRVRSLTIAPVLWSKTSGFNGIEQAFPFSFSVTTAEDVTEDEEQLRRELLALIEQLQEELARLRGETPSSPNLSCASFARNLSFGLSKDPQVRCLQEFLAQFPEVYPEGLVTGNFGPLTRQAVIRFQELHAPDVLTPLGLSSGTGFVGPSTRAKINDLIGR